MLQERRLDTEGTVGWMVEMDDRLYIEIGNK